MEYERQPAGEPLETVDLKLGAHGIADLAPYHGGVDASFFKHVAAADHAGYAAAAAFALPVVGDKDGLAVHFFEGAADRILQRIYVPDPTVAELAGLVLLKGGI